MFLGQIRGDSIFRGARPFHIHFGGKEWAGGGGGGRRWGWGGGAGGAAFSSSVVAPGHIIGQNAL